MKARGKVMTDRGNITHQNPETWENSTYTCLKHWIIILRKKIKTLEVAMIAHLWSFSFYDTFMYQKEKLDQVPLRHKSKATRKRRLHAWRVGVVGMGAVKKSWWFNFPWQILHCRFAKSQSNSLWWCHLSLGWLHILNNHVTNTPGLSPREAETRWATLLSLSVLTSCWSSSLS